MPPRVRSASDRSFAPPRAIARVLRVIETIAVNARPMSLAELSVELGVPKTSLYAIVKGLEQCAYVSFERESYALGPKARKLAETIAGGGSFPGNTLPVLEQLAEASGETVILGTLSEDRRYVVYAIVIETDSWLRFSVKVGTRRPLSAAASGHAILSFLPLAERERYLRSGPFERFTRKTIATSTGLRTAIAKARRQHCAMSIDGTVEAATGIAAPYFGPAGTVAGAVLIAAPSARVADRVKEIKATVIEGARAISRILTYTGRYPP